MFYLKGPESPFRSAYDIALIVLKTKVVLGPKIQIAQLPKADSACPKGKNLVASGWGRDYTRHLRPRNNLWAVMQECFNASSCPELDNPDNQLGYEPKTNLLCAGDSENKLNSQCFYDSGGKLYCESKSEWQ